MDDDLFEFEAPPEAAPQLILGKKKKKKKKKDVTTPAAPVESEVNAAEPLVMSKKSKNSQENGNSDITSSFAAPLADDHDEDDDHDPLLPTSAFAALGVDDSADHAGLDDSSKLSADAEENQLAPMPTSKKKKKKKKKNLVLDPLDQQDPVGDDADPESPALNQSTATAEPDDFVEFIDTPSVPSKKKKKKKALGLDPPQDDVTAEDRTSLEPQLEVEPEPQPPAEPAAELKRPMTAAEKKKAKKERERLAKLEKAKKEQDELDAILAELGEGNASTAAGASNDNANGNAEPEAAPMTAAQKKRAKKKKKAAAEKEDDPEVDALLAELGGTDSAPTVAAAPESKDADDVDDLLAELAGDAPAVAKKKPKKKKKKGGAKAEEDGTAGLNAESVAPVETKKPKKKESAAVRRMREQREKMLAEEERIRKEKEAEEARIAEEERIRLEEIRKKELEKAKKKAAEKAKKERKRKEGTLLSKAEKERRRKAEMFRKQLEEQGMIPTVGTNDQGEQTDKPKRVVYDKKKRNRSINAVAERKESVVEKADETVPTEPEKSITPVPEPEVIPDAWDELPEVEKTTGETGEQVDNTRDAVDKNEEVDSDEEDSESEDSDDSDDSEYEGMTRAEVAAEKRLEALRKERYKMREDARAARTADHLRSPIICILGHVDTGKTKILDRIRKTNVQDGEAGGITQQIGATYFPIEAVKKEATKLKEGKKLEYNVPSLLIIDTPGHESFTNLRSRGSSLCDIAILVIDIMHGLEPQTRESIDLLKLRKTPFIIALNKIDRIYDWDAQPHNCPTRDSLAKQPRHAREEFERRVRETKLELAEIGFNTELYWDNKDVRKFVSIVPTSAISGEGIPDLLMLLLALPQRLLAERLMFSPILEATVLEVKVIEGLGTTIDIVLTGGTIHEGDTIMVVGLDGPIVTAIRALLTPHPMKEMRVKGQYLHHKEIKAAQGIKISADNLEKAVAGTQLLVVEDPTNEDEMAYVRDEVMKDFKTILTSVDKSGLGVYVQASTLGSLEALLEFLRTSKIPVSGINIGPVHKRDVTKASTMLERRKEYATILAFDVGVEKEARELSEDVGVKIFTADIIYHLFDQFSAYMEEMKKRRREDVNDDVVFPSICKILPQHIYNKKDPIVLGVDVMEGILRVGTPLVVRHGTGWLDIGRVASLELNKKQVITARKGESVAVKIQSKNTEHIMYGRHFDFQNELVSKMSRNAIDLLKENFRDDLGKEEWLLVIKLKKWFDII